MTRSQAVIVALAAVYLLLVVLLATGVFDQAAGDLLRGWLS